VPIGNIGRTQRAGGFSDSLCPTCSASPLTGLSRLLAIPPLPTTSGERGIFKVHSATKERKLLVSYRQLGGALKSQESHWTEGGVINHTMWIRNDAHLLFWRGLRVTAILKTCSTVPITMASDGIDVQTLHHTIGGHVDGSPITSDRTRSTDDKSYSISDVRPRRNNWGRRRFSVAKGTSLCRPDGRGSSPAHETGDPRRINFTSFAAGGCRLDTHPRFDRGRTRRIGQSIPRPGWNRFGQRNSLSGALRMIQLALDNSM